MPNVPFWTKSWFAENHCSKRLCFCDQLIVGTTVFRPAIWFHLYAESNEHTELASNTETLIETEQADSYSLVGWLGDGGTEQKGKMHKDNSVVIAGVGA